jgi:nucleotide-binding universal stress UspA family protein
MKKILCPTDFSDAAISGITYAAKLAKRMDAEITLFNVVALSDLLPEEVLMGEKVNTETAKLRLEKQSNEVTKVFKVSCYCDAVASPISITNMIKEKSAGYDLMVMGSNGEDDFAQFLRGSHTYQIIKKTSLPVIMVPHDVMYSEISRVVYAYAFREHPDLPIRQLISFCKVTQSHLTILEVSQQEKAESIEQQWRNTFNKLSDFYKDDVPIKFETIKTDNVTDGINQFMKQSGADLLALCSEHHNFVKNLFHKSILKSITGSANYPVLVFHA